MPEIPKTFKDLYLIAYKAGGLAAISGIDLIIDEHRELGPTIEIAEMDKIIAQCKEALLRYESPGGA